MEATGEDVRSKAKVGIMNFIVFVLCFSFCIFVLYYNHNYFILNADSYAISEMGHVAFGIGLAAFWLMFGFKKSMVLNISIISMLVWELYEYLTGFITPIDTILDIVIGFGFAWLYLEVMK